MRRVECFGYLAHEIERSLRLEQFLVSQQLAQVRAFDVGHCEVEDAVLLTGGERGDDVRVVQVRRQLRLSEKAAAKPLIGRQTWVEHLHRGAGARCRVGSQVDSTGRPLGDERLEPKAREDGSDGGYRCQRLAGTLTQAGSLQWVRLRVPLSPLRSTPASCSVNCSDSASVTSTSRAGPTFATRSPAKASSSAYPAPTLASDWQGTAGTHGY